MKSKPDPQGYQADLLPKPSVWGAEHIRVPAGARCALCVEWATGGAEHEGRFIGVCDRHHLGAWEMLLTPELAAEKRDV